jgi:hypothetical protein
MHASLNFHLASQQMGRKDNRLGKANQINSEFAVNDQ